MFWFLVYVLITLVLVAWAARPGLRRPVRLAAARIARRMRAWVRRYLMLHA